MGFEVMKVVSWWKRGADLTLVDATIGPLFNLPLQHLFGDATFSVSHLEFGRLAIGIVFI